MSANTLRMPDVTVAATGPLYQQVKQHVLAKISSGEWPVHQKLPSEHQLVAELGVSRMTVHRALKELTEEHVLRRVPGVGTFVASGEGHLTLLRIEDIRDEIASRGNAHSCDVVVLRRERVGGEIATLFGLRAQATLFHSQIVHRENERPVMVEDKYVCPKLVPEYLDQDFAKTSATSYLMSAVLATEAEQCIEAVEPSRAVRKLLARKKGPCLRYSRRLWVHDTVALYCERVYPGSPYRLGSRFPTGVEGPANEPR